MFNNKTNLSYSNPAFLVATLFGTGKIKYMPGTFGSLIGCVISILLYLIIFKISEFLVYSVIYPNTDYFLNLNIFFIGTNLCAFVISNIVFCILAVWSIKKYLPYCNDDDPKEIVIDELIGMNICLYLCSMAFFIILPFISYNKLPCSFVTSNVIFLVIIPFLLFRFFDASKIWPINWFEEKFDGAFGIIIDDVIAAILASVFYYAIMFSILDYLK